MSREYLERLVDRDALAEYLTQSFGQAEQFAVEWHEAGHSNETLFVTWGEREMVVRRPPPGEVAETAHDVLREYRVIEALDRTPVPTPTPLAACEDHDVIGSDFYIMERVEGDVLRSEESDRFADPAARERIGQELLQTLAAIHDVDYRAVGLDDLGRPEGYTERQVERWTKQLSWAFETTRSRRAVPALESIGEWLAANVPDTHPETLVHGDYKLDNVMLAPGTPPEAVAVFDWELSTLGDPFTDLGWLLLFWQDESDPDPPMPDLMPSFVARPGYPSRSDLVDEYERLTGRTFEPRRFYRVLAAYKMTALGEMFFARYLNGDSDDPLYPHMEQRVPALAKRTRDFLDGNTDAL